MTLELAPARPDDVAELGRIAYEAFKDVSDRHGFPSDFTSVAMARSVIGTLVRGEERYGVAARWDGQIAGSTFVLLADEVGGVGPVTVEVPLQGNGIGRGMMEDAIGHARRAGVERLRLLQDSFNTASLSLYASLGFDVKEPVALMQPVASDAPDAGVSPLAEADLPAVEELSQRVYRVSRRNEVASLMRSPFRPFVRERQGRVTGYFILGIPGHGVAETEDDLVALVRETTRQAPPDLHRIICPLTEGSLYRALLAGGCRTIKVMNLMALGPYERPDGVWMPSVLY